MFSLRDTHQIAQAQQQKNAKLREAFGISEYFVEGSSFDADRKAKEDLAKSEAIQKEMEADKEADKANRKRYALVRTPSNEKETSPGKEVSADDDRSKDKKKKKKKNRERFVNYFQCKFKKYSKYIYLIILGRPAQNARRTKRKSRRRIRKRGKAHIEFKKVN